MKVKTHAIWELLARRNMSQNDLAKMAGVSSGHLSLMVNGERHPSPCVRRKILEALAPTEFDEIFEIEEEGVHVDPD